MKISAVVVLYNPNKKNVISNILSYIDFVDKLYVIDNSDNSNESDFSFNSKIEYLANLKNLGIATVLNMAAEKSIIAGYDFMLTMDQDSYFDCNMIIRYIKTLFEIDWHNVSMVGITPKSPNDEIKEFSEFKPISSEEKLIITSGSVINLKIFSKIYGFNENLFIDCVDYDYCLRSIVSKYKIIQFKNIYLNHIGGKPKIILGKKIALYGNERMYYIFRNNLYLWLKYFYKFPILIFKNIVFNILFCFLPNFLFSKNKIGIVLVFFKALKDLPGLFIKKNEFKKNSWLMDFFLFLGCDSIAWSLRRLYCPVKKNDLVLEIGSGGNPYFRSNVLCDAYMRTGERGFAPLVADRPTVLAFAENLPFKDNSFDFIVASHVLEHSKNPEKFLSEIQRVGRAGYIEVPDSFFERLNNYSVHALEITDENNELIIKKKIAPVTDSDLVYLYRKTKPIFLKWYSKFPFNFHVRYYWNKNNGGIRYKIVNNDYEFTWLPIEDYEQQKEKLTLIIFIKRYILQLIRKFFSQNRRNKKINLLELMRCNNCGGMLKKEGSNYFCIDCQGNFKNISESIVDCTNL